METHWKEIQAQSILDLFEFQVFLKFRESERKSTASNAPCGVLWGAQMGVLRCVPAFVQLFGHLLQSVDTHLEPAYATDIVAHSSTRI